MIQQRNVEKVYRTGRSRRRLSDVNLEVRRQFISSWAPRPGQEHLPTSSACRSAHEGTRRDRRREVRSFATGTSQVRNSESLRLPAFHLVGPTERPRQSQVAPALPPHGVVGRGSPRERRRARRACSHAAPFPPAIGGPSSRRDRRASSAKPSPAFADEPTGNLDSSGRRDHERPAERTAARHPGRDRTQDPPTPTEPADHWLSRPPVQWAIACSATISDRTQVPPGSLHLHSRFAISFTLVILVVIAALLDTAYGTTPPETSRARAGA